MLRPGRPHVLDGLVVQLPAASTSTSSHAGNGHSESSTTSSCTMRVYRPPFEEFEIRLVEVPPGCSAALPVNKGPMVMLVQQGEGTAMVAEGSGGSCSDGLQSCCELHRGEHRVWGTCMEY